MHMYFDGETCVSKTTCGEHEDYIPESNTCKCSEGYHEEESKCVEDWVICDENQYLVRVPTTNKCVCMDTYILLNEVCVGKAVCDEVAEVYIATNNTCECAQNYVDVGKGCELKVKCNPEKG